MESTSAATKPRYRLAEHRGAFASTEHSQERKGPSRRTAVLVTGVSERAWRAEGRNYPRNNS